MKKSNKIFGTLILITMILIGGLGPIFILNDRCGPRVWCTPWGPSEITDAQLIKIGILGPMTNSFGVAMYRGAFLKAWEINAAGGVMVNGTRMYIALAKQDTKESAADPLAETAVNAVDKLINIKGAEYIIGGFRTESVIIYMEDVMDAETMFLDVGAADLSLVQGLNSSSASYDYDRYKYFFRSMPHNLNLQAFDVMEFVKYLQTEIVAVADAQTSGPYRYVNSTNFNVTKIAFIRENLDWTEGFATTITEGLNETGDIEVLQFEYAPTATYTDFAGYWNAIEAFGAQITIPICSSAGSKPMMQAYTDVEPHCIVAGVDVPGSKSTFWADTGGECNGEVVAASAARLNVSYSALSVPFFNHYVGNYSVSPGYTATGAYDAVGLLAFAINTTGSFDTDDLIPEFESWDEYNPLIDQTAAVQKFSFTSQAFRTSMISAGYGAYAMIPHDVVGGYLGLYINSMSGDVVSPQGYFNIFFAQWQDGQLKCIPGQGTAAASYDASLAQANLTLPAQGLNGLPAS